MKLVGEYELTEAGVRIMGKINDSHIHDVRTLLAPFKTQRIYRGDVDTVSKMYQVPNVGYRPYVMRNLPHIMTPETEKDFVTLPKLPIHDLDRQANFDMYYRDGGVFMQNLGILIGDGEGRAPVQNRRIFSYTSLRRGKTRMLTNSAWVWGVDESGNFDIELEGLVNRHMMTVILSNATKLAKYIDTVLVKTLDKPDLFTQEVVEQAQQRRVLAFNSYESQRF